MKTEPNPPLPNVAEGTRSLTDVRAQLRRVNDLIDECSVELLAVKTVLKQALVSPDPLPDISAALGKNEAVQSKVHAASARLSAITRALDGEVRDRNMLDHQMAAIIEQKEAAHHEALHDGLTGLPNRVLFNDRLEHGFAQAKRHGWSLAVMFMDLNDFKQINDSHGHGTGDSILRIVAQRLMDNTRGDDTVSRHGGDEFLYLATEIQNENNSVLLAQKIIRIIEAPINMTLHDVDVTFSIKASVGVSLYPKDGTTSEVLVRRADEAMYRAKKAKSRFAFAT